MCVALPGKVIALDKDIATVDFRGNIVKANSGIVEIKVGDYVLVHAGLIIQKLNPEEAENMTELFSVIEELENE